MQEYKRNNTEFNCMHYSKKSKELYAGTSTGVILRVQLDKKTNELTDVVTEEKHKVVEEKETTKQEVQEAIDENDEYDDDDEDNSDEDSIGEVPEFDDDEVPHYGLKKPQQEPPIELGPTPFDKVYKGTVGTALPTFVTKSRLLADKQLDKELWRILKKQK